MKRIEIEQAINNLISERFFSGIRQLIIQKQKDRFVKSIMSPEKATI